MAEPSPEQVRELGSVLRQLLVGHERLAELIGEKRDALRHADADAVADAVAAENAQLRVISELEKRRLELAGELTLALDPAAREPLRLGELAQRLGDPDGPALAELRERLLGAMQQARRQTTVVQQATEALARHTTGLVQTISGLVSKAGTYSRKGAVPSAALAVSTFNTTV